MQCPYTDACRAQALAEWAAIPELAALFATHDRCSADDAAVQQRCAETLGLVEEEAEREEVAP